MDRHRWLDAAVARIPDPAKAREVREELDNHVTAIVDGLVTGGWTPDAAEAEAQRRMGDPVRVGRSLAGATAARWSPGQRTAIILGAVFLFLAGLRQFGLAGGFGVVGVPVTVAAAAAPVWAVTAAGRHGPWANLCAWVCMHRWALGMWAAVGLIGGLLPLHYVMPGLMDSPAWPWWNLPYWLAWIVPMAVTAWSAVDSLDALATAAVGLWPLILLFALGGAFVLAVHPSAPAGPVTWLPDWHTMLSPGVLLMSAPVYGSLAVMGVVISRAVRHAVRRVGSARPTVRN